MEQNQGTRARVDARPFDLHPKAIILQRDWQQHATIECSSGPSQPAAPRWNTARLFRKDVRREEPVRVPCGIADRDNMSHHASRAQSLDIIRVQTNGLENFRVVLAEFRT